MIVKRLRPIIIIVAMIWIAEAVNFFLGHSLSSWGILPRSVSGLTGIPLAPLLHGGIWHTISNTLPLLFLGGLTLIRGEARFWETSINITLLSGFLVWLFARDAYHVGASGLVFGYFGAILSRAVIERSLSSMFIGIITVMFYGGLIWGLLPVGRYISFESHLFGFAAGIFFVWLEVKLNRTKLTT